MPPTTKALLVFAIVALVTPSFCTSQSYSTWNKISPSGPSIGPVTGHVGVPDHSSDAAFIFGGHSGDSIRSTITFGCSHFTEKLGKNFLQNLHIRLPDMVIVEHHAIWIQELMLCFLEELLQQAA